MHKYEMDPTRTVSATERTDTGCGTDGRTDGRTEWNQYTQQLRCAGVKESFSFPGEEGHCNDSQADVFRHVVIDSSLMIQYSDIYILSIGSASVDIAG